MDLHELFASLVEELPPMDDQTPAAATAVRRRRTRNRYALAASACALVIGTGTITVAGPWRHTGVAPLSWGPPTHAVTGLPSAWLVSPSGSPSASPGTSASASPSTSATTPVMVYEAQYRTYALGVIRSLYPVTGLQLSLDQTSGYDTPDNMGILVTADGKTVYAGDLRPVEWPRKVLGGRVANQCHSTPPPGVTSVDYACTSTTLADGTLVMIERWDDGGKLAAEVHVWHGLDDLSLSLNGVIAGDATTAELFAFAENPAYAQLYTQAARLDLFSHTVIQGWGA